MTQPWATLKALGDKKLDTRSWSTSYRGPVAIHAAKGYPKWAREVAGTQPFRGLLERSGYGVTRPLPLGAVLEVGTLVDVRPTGMIKYDLDEQERALGDYTLGRYAWVFENMRALVQPIPCRGALGLWRVPDDLAATLALE